MNQVVLSGNLGANAEVREFNGQSLITFSLATTDKWKTKEGEQKSETQWHSCQYWTKSPKLADYLTKGKSIIATGKIVYSEKDGKYYTAIRLNNIEFAGGNNQSQQTNQAQPSQQASQQQTVGQGEDTELPF